MSDDYVLYVIELEPEEDPEAKWYVGISQNPEERIKKHRTGNGANWTQRNTIVDDFQLGHGSDWVIRDLERVLTIVLMQEFGAESTRGAKFLSPNLVHYPKFERGYLPPALADSLVETEHPALSRIGEEKGAVFLDVDDEITFEDFATAKSWADENLPSGTNITIRKPGMSKESNLKTE